jgi:SHAQKYF class myb-like DNA-binding protein
MKLFNEGVTKDQTKYRFKGYYSFKIISDSSSRSHELSGFRISSSNNNSRLENSNYTSGQDAVFSLCNNRLMGNNENLVSLTLNNDTSFECKENYSNSNENINSAYKYLEGLDNITFSHNNNINNNMTSGYKHSFNSELFPSDLIQKSKKPRLLKLHLRSHRNKKSVYNIGRWTEEEHRRFIEAILKYGNDWKNVQKHIRTRSSTQSRSHSQKFFLKIKNYDLFDFKDRKPCISSLNELAKNLDEKQIEKMTDLLISYEYQDNPEKKQSHEKMLLKKRKKSVFPSFEFEGEESYLKCNGTISKNQEMFNINNINNIHNVSKEGRLYNYRLQSYNRKLSELENYNSLSNHNNSNDDFKDHFFKVFNQKNRRLSFEDNILIMFSHAMIEDNEGDAEINKSTIVNKQSKSSDSKSRSASESPSGSASASASSYDSDELNESIGEESLVNSHESDSWVNTIIDFTQNCVRIN